MNGVMEEMNCELEIPFNNHPSFDERWFLKRMREGLDKLIHYTRTLLSTNEADNLLNTELENFYEKFRSTIL